MSYALGVRDAKAMLPWPLVFWDVPHGGPWRKIMRLKKWTEDQAAVVYAQCESAQALLDGVRETANANDLGTSRRLMQGLGQFLCKMQRESRPAELSRDKGDPKDVRPQAERTLAATKEALDRDRGYHPGIAVTS